MPHGTILIVDDDVPVARAIARALGRFGYHVVTVSSWKEVVRRVQEERPSVVVMDVRLDGDVDGVTLAEELFVCEDTPVVFLTGTTDDATTRRMAASCAYGYLTKPASMTELRVALEMTIERHADLRARCDRVAWVTRALNKLDDAMLGVDRQGIVRFMNAAFVRLSPPHTLRITVGSAPAWAERIMTLPEADLATWSELSEPLWVRRYELEDLGFLFVLRRLPPAAA